MVMLKVIMLRRTFMKQMGIQLLALVVGANLKPITTPTEFLQAASQNTAYGSGTYGQGSYAGPVNKIYLPIVNKEGN